MTRMRHGLVLACVLGLVGAVVLGDEKGDRGRGKDDKGDKSGKTEKKTTDVQVLAIRATTKNKEISPELSSIADALKKQFKFTGFKLEDRANDNVESGKAFAKSVVGGYRVSVTPQKNDGKKVQMQVEVFAGTERKVNVNLTLDAGKSQLVGGLKLDGGDELVLAISAR